MNCVVCAREIPEGARKCHQCGEFQSFAWRLAAGLDLRGLLALLPLLTLIYAFLADRLEVQASDLRLTAVSCQQDRVTLFGSNTGNRSAVLAGVRFAVGRSAGDGSAGDGSAGGALDPEADTGGRIFEAGSSRLLTMTVDARRNPGGLVPFDARQDPECRVDLTFEIVQFDHSRTEATSSCACPSA